MPATQFAQIALVVTEKAAFEDMQSKDSRSNVTTAIFAGHFPRRILCPCLRLLASFPSLLSSMSCSIVASNMQSAVERDSQNRSNYAMCAVNPSRISPSFNDSALREVVDDISRKTNCLLEIVNFNVEVCSTFFV
jgi:fatty acid synthase subunit alpha